MTWMLTASGQQLDLRFIAGQHDAIEVDDIAHHLAQLNRFTGACVRPYSVAEHSLLVYEIVERAIGTQRPTALLAALMHDAHEAYTADLSAPMKQVLGYGWQCHEDHIAHAVRRRFGLAEAFGTHGDLIRWADLTALSTERAQLMPARGPQWEVSRTHPPADWIRLAEREAFSWRDWRQAFLDCFDSLHYARALMADEEQLSPPCPTPAGGTLPGALIP